MRPPVSRPLNTRAESRKLLEEESFEELDKYSGVTYDQLTSLRSELFNINNRINRNDDLSFHNSNQNSNVRMLDSSENAGLTRPSTNGYIKLELDPIDHERSKMKLKLLLEKQIQKATGQK